MKIDIYRYLRVTLFITFLLFIGCEKKDYTKIPPKMHWDRDLCERCKMAISERNYGVIAIDSHNKIYKFDDIGCLILWQKQERPDIEIEKIWIKDANSSQWIDALSAIYAKGYKTPMDYNFGAFTKTTFPKDKRRYTFIEVKEEVLKKNR